MVSVPTCQHALPWQVHMQISWQHWPGHGGTALLCLMHRSGSMLTWKCLCAKQLLSGGILAMTIHTASQQFHHKSETGRLFVLWSAELAAHTLLIDFLLSIVFCLLSSLCSLLCPLLQL